MCSRIRASTDGINLHGRRITSTFAYQYKSYLTQVYKSPYSEFVLNVQIFITARSDLSPVSYLSIVQL